MGFPRSTATAPSVRPGLPATDRCDACGAQALARATSPAGAVLLFCRHHATSNTEGLRAQGFAIETFYEALESHDG